MGTSPDVGGRAGLGRPMQPEVHELETTAQTQVMKAGLGLVPNTLDVPLTQLGGNIWKYESPATKPSIPMNVLKAVSRPDVKTSSKLEEQHYQALLEELPLSLSLELKQQKKLPYTDRDPRFLVLEQIIRFAARALAWFDDVSLVDPNDHPERISKYQMLPTLLLRGWIETTESYLDELKQLSRETHSPEIMGLEKENKKLLTPLLKAGKEVLKTKEETKRKKCIQNLKSQLIHICHQYDLKKLPSALQLTGALLHALLPPVAALHSPEQATLLLPLLTAQESLSQKWNRKGCFGPGYGAIFNAFEQAIPEELSIEKTAFLSILQILTVTFSGLVLEASGLVKATAEENQNENTEHYLEARSLAFTLAAAFLTSTEGLPHLAKQLIDFLPFERSLKDALPAGISLTAMHALLFAGLKGDKVAKKAKPLLLGTHHALTKELLKAKKSLKIIKGNPLAARMTQVAQQGLLALKQRSMKGYLEATKRGLHIVGKRLDTMQLESETVLDTSLSILYACHRLAQQGNFTSVVTQAA